MKLPDTMMHHPEKPLDSSLREMWQVNKYLWMSLASVLIYLPVAQAQGLIVTSPGVAWVFFAVAMADGISRSLLAYYLGGRLPARLAWFYTYLDILLVSAAVGITRGLDSDLWLLYFVVMIFESLYATPLQKRWLDCLMVLAYLLATLPYQRQEPLPLPYPVYWRIVCMRLFFLILVSALARRISANVNARNREIALLHEQKTLAEDRARIAREIHDGLGHALVSSIVRLELCSRLIHKAPEEAEALLKEEVPALRAAWNEGRDLAFHLRPWELTGETELVETLRRHIGRFAERTGLVVELKTEGEVSRLRPQAAFGLSRIVQEALTNAAKHAGATVIEVLLTTLPHDGVRCTIKDNGRGFELETGTSGMGLQAMRERAENLKGTLTIQSAPGSGTEIIVTLPGNG